MNAVRRLLLVAMAWFIALAMLAPTASAQQEQVSLTLASQTPWATPEDPFMQFAVSTQERGGQDLDDLWMRVTFLEPLLGRSELRVAMTQDTGGELSTTTLPLTPLDAGETVVQEGRVKVAFLEPLATEARVYPVRMEVAQGREGPALATLRTALVFLPEPPEQPLNLAWTFVLGHPLEFGPDGVFLGRALERRLEPGGSLAGLTGALSRMLAGASREPVDVVVSPTLLADLRNMSDGYDVITGRGETTVEAGQGPSADAARVLDEITAIASTPEVEVSAMPFAVPDLPQMLASGLGMDIPAQLRYGRVSVAGLGVGEPAAPAVEGTAALGAPAEALPDATVLRPPGSSLDEATLQVLRREGVATLLLDAGVVQQPAQPNEFAPPVAADLGSGLIAAVPDEGLQELIEGQLAHDDPHLAAQWLLADLASIWLEQPDVERASALIVSGEQALPATFFEPFVRNVAAAPWLRPAKASNLLDRLPPESAPDKVRLREGEPIPSAYLDAIRLNAELISRYRAILADPGSTALPEQLSRDLLLTEGSYLIERDRLGWDWLNSITTRVQGELGKVGADTQQVVTLTSSGGRIPVRLTNDAEQALKVRVELLSSRLRFPGGSSRLLTLDPGQTRVLVFDAAAQTTGTFPVQVAVQTPEGDVLSESRIIVRSTAYNLVALTVTLGAILVLMALWGRRHISLKRR